MSRSATARFDLWGEERTFRLTARALQDLQEKCDGGPGWIYGLLQSGMDKYEYIIEPLRLGLIHGGTPAAEVERLVKQFAIPLADNVMPAMTVLAAVVTGVPDEVPKGYGETAASLTPIFPEVKSASPPSGAGAGQWAST